MKMMSKGLGDALMPKPRLTPFSPWILTRSLVYLLPLAVQVEVGLSLALSHRLNLPPVDNHEHARVQDEVLSSIGWNAEKTS